MGIRGTGSALCRHGLRIQSAKFLGSGSLSYRWIFLRSGWLFGHEDCHLCLCTYSSCCTKFTQQRAAHCVPKRSCHGTGGSRTGTARHFFLVSLAGSLRSGRYDESDFETLYDYHNHAYFWYGSFYSGSLRPRRRRHLYQSCRCRS